MGARTYHRPSCLAFYLSFGPKYMRRDAKKRGENQKETVGEEVERCYCTLSTLSAERRALGMSILSIVNCNIMQRSLRWIKNGNDVYFRHFPTQSRYQQKSCWVNSFHSHDLIGRKRRNNRLHFFPCIVQNSIIRISFSILRTRNGRDLDIQLEILHSKLFIQGPANGACT